MNIVNMHVNNMHQQMVYLMKGQKSDEICNFFTLLVTKFKLEGINICISS